MSYHLQSELMFFSLFSYCFPWKDIFLKITKTLFALKFCDSPGFISLDCGLSPSESPYTDPVTGLIFLSDADFIQSGKRGEVGDDESYTYKQFKDLRYFPDGVRNCYNLTVNKGISYLIRAGFSYGNYDGLNISPRFHMHIGPNMWTSVVVGSESYREIIYMSKSNLLQICLVKTGETIPIISTLELRPLRNDSYMTQFGPLDLIFRRTYTSDTFGYIRYVMSASAILYPKNITDSLYLWYAFYLFIMSKLFNLHG